MYLTYYDYPWFDTEILMFFYLFFFYFLGLQMLDMEVPRLGVISELQLQAYILATATQDGSKPHLWPTPQLMAMLDP